MIGTGLGTEQCEAIGLATLSWFRHSMKAFTQFCTTNLTLVPVRVSVPASVKTPQGNLFLKVGQKDESIIS